MDNIDYTRNKNTGVLPRQANSRELARETTNAFQAPTDIPAAITFNT